MSVDLDVIMKRHFDTAEDFAASMKLFYQYCEAKNKFTTFTELETHFLSRLGDVVEDLSLNGDSARLEAAIAFKRDEAKEYGTSPLDVRVAGYPLTEQVVKEIVRSELNESRIQFSEALKNQNKVNLTPITLKEACRLFIATNKINWKSLSSLKKYEDDTFPLILEIFGENMSTINLTQEHSNFFKKIIFNYPKNRNKIGAYKSLTIQEIVDLDIPEDQQLSTQTKSHYITRFIKFLRWLEQSGYSVGNLDRPLVRTIKADKRPDKQKAVFSDEDLAKLFNSKEYIQGTLTDPFKYWVPLIGLFTGARINEICQLRLEDIYKDPQYDVWVFDINEKNHKETRKSLKRPHHIRLIPIHSELIKLNFLTYLNELKLRNIDRIFPELKYHETNRFGNTAGRWFNRTYKKNCKTTTPITSFHSLRHNIINNLVNRAGFTENEIASMLGQSSTGGVTATRYMKPRGLEHNINYISKLNYQHCIKFGLIRSWERQDFGRNINNYLKKITTESK
jgi:integrase